MMKLLRKKILDWLFDTDYIWYEDLFNTYNKIYNSYEEIYKNYQDATDKLLKYYNKDKELDEEYLKILDHCKNIIEHCKKLEAKLKENNIDISDLKL